LLALKPVALMFEKSLHHPDRLRTVIVLSFVAVMLWSTSIAYLWTFESAIVFQNRRTQFVRLELPSDELTKLRTNDGIALDARALTHGNGSGYWILFCQASGGTIHHGGDPRSLHAAGYNVFAFDYRGFGRNRGTPSEAGLYEDALTAYRHLRDQLAVPPDRIILAGRSLGSAVAIELATRVPSGGLLLLSAIDSVPATGSRLYFWAPVRLLASAGFDSMAKAPLITVPVIEVHATDDSFVPVRAARALFQRFPARKEMLELPGGHNDVGNPVGDSFRSALTRFWPVSEFGRAVRQRSPDIRLEPVIKSRSAHETGQS
jgi:uncharacterized protein